MEHPWGDLRCRPELSPDDGSWRRGDDAVARALKLIDAGVLAEQPLAALAERMHLGEHQPTKRFLLQLEGALRRDADLFGTEREGGFAGA